MLLRPPIKILFTISFVLLSFGLTAQSDTLGYVQSPYHNEATPHFKFGQFKRGFSSDLLKAELDSLESKPRSFWSRADSLQFAQVSLQTGNTALSQYYFDHLKVDIKSESSYWFDQLMIYYLNRDFEGGLSKIISESPMVLEFSEIYFYRKIFQAQVYQAADSKWYKTHEVLQWKVDSSLMQLDREDPEFRAAVTQPLINLEKVLKKIVSHVHADDPVLANTFREMGHIVHGYFSLTQAFIAYSIGRHYNKRDKDVLEDMKMVQAQLNERKYKVPNFRKYFPRTEEWRFDYKVLKEKIIEARADTVVYVRPETMKPKKKPILPFPHQFVVLGGLLLMIILLGFLLKSR